MKSVTEIVWKDIQQNEELEAIIEKVIQKCFEVEHINPTSLYICVTLTDPKNIREINKEYRNIDKETDVLSFPMFEKDELDKLVDETADTQVETFILKEWRNKQKNMNIVLKENLHICLFMDFIT